MKISERIPHNGNGMPVPPGTLVWIVFRGGYDQLAEGIECDTADCWDWEWFDIDPERDIIAYYIVTEE